MRFAYFGNDFFVASLERLLEDGHELIAVRTFVVDGEFVNTNDRLLELADRLQVPVAWGRPCSDDLDALCLAGCEAALLLGFRHRVPVSKRLRCVNLHPTLLPEGRGEFPLPWLILHHPEHSGLTLHKIAEDLDSGPILAQLPVPLSADESLVSLCAKMQIAACGFVSATMRDFDAQWLGARPVRGRGSNCHVDEADWTLPWAEGWERVVRTVRAFGPLGCAAIADGETWFVSDAAGWKAEHSRRPGTVVHRMPAGLVDAAEGGLVWLRDPVRAASNEAPARLCNS